MKQIVHALAAPRRGKGRVQRGSALVTALISLFFVMVIGAGILAHTMQGLKLSKRAKTSTAAFNLAESGAELGLRWLKDQSSPPSGGSAFDPFNGAQSMGGGTYQVSIIPDPGNAGAVLKTFKVVADGTFAGKIERVELVMKQQSFGKFAYFTHSETSSITNGRVWFIPSDRIRGPAHSNNASASNFQINWGNTGAIFQGMVTSVANSISYAPSNPANEADYLKVYKTGSQGYQLGVDVIQMPSSSDVQKAAAWGATSGYPGGNGVYTPANGGIYVVGNSSVVAQVDGSGNQEFAITQGANTTTVKVDVQNNRRQWRLNNGSWNTVSGAGTGVLFSTGDITSLRGTIADNKLSGSPPSVQYRSATTIATDINAGRNITLTNNLRYASSPDPNLPTNDVVNLRPGTLGLMARNVRIRTGAPQNMFIDATMLAGSSTTIDGSFYVQDYNTKVPTGTLRIMGGIIQRNRGPVGTVSNGNLQTGYAKDYYYDPRVADNPPPFFPTTGSYDKLSWRRLAVSGN
ncbi:MAG: hypothetical protein WAO58_13555 [Fimbriimonadaceae bacterium]